MVNNIYWLGLFPYLVIQRYEQIFYKPKVWAKKIKKTFFENILHFVWRSQKKAIPLYHKVKVKATKPL